MSENDESPLLLIVEDDERFAETLAAEMRDRGYRVSAVASLAALRGLPEDPPAFAVIDLRLRGDSGLDAIQHVDQRWPECNSVVLTGYGSIATAVQAVKLGARNYLTKPVDIDAIERALLGENVDDEIAVPEEFQSLARHEREYIEYVLAECSGNISQAARRLGLHRQSLQRKLRKYTPR